MESLLATKNEHFMFFSKVFNDPSILFSGTPSRYAEKKKRAETVRVKSGPFERQKNDEKQQKDQENKDGSLTKATVEKRKMNGIMNR